MRTCVYLAGPMTGRKDWSHPAFHAAAIEPRARGYFVANPSEFNAGKRRSQMNQDRTVETRWTYDT